MNPHDILLDASVGKIDQIEVDQFDHDNEKRIIEKVDPYRHLSLYRKLLDEKYGDSSNYIAKVVKALPEIQKIKIMVQLPDGKNIPTITGDHNLGFQRFVQSSEVGVSDITYFQAIHYQDLLGNYTYDHIQKIIKMLPGKKQEKIMLLVVLLGLPLCGEAQYIEIKKQKKLIRNNVGMLGEYIISGATDYGLPNILGFSIDDCWIDYISNIEGYNACLYLQTNN